jgi:peptidoglycan hydrolase CwlO-like protein
VEKFSEFMDSLPKSTIVSLIAITIVFLPIWISTGTPDSASQYSFFLLAIALPILILGFAVCQLPKQFFSSKANKALRMASTIIGPSFALTGVSCAIWHVSQTVAIAFSIVCVVCMNIFAYFQLYFRHSLQKDTKKIDELKKRSDELNKQIDELKNKQAELKKQPELHQKQLDIVEKQLDEFEKRFDINKNIAQTLAHKYEITINKPS